MSYTLIVPARVQRQLDRLPDSMYDRVAPAISALADNPRPVGCVKLAGTAREYRIRIGDYRVRYEIRDDESTVIVVRCEHRKDVYRR